jgi:poly-gamma-glutamate synthesis protein (capsule biosynthesis protein)
MIKINFLGDWAPVNRDVKSINLNNFSFLNIEGPLLKKNKILSLIKAGPTISSKNFFKFKSKGVGILANNHLFDYGYYGYKETVSLLRKNNFFYVGAGKTKRDAEKPLILNLNNIKIGVLARCEIQFGISQANKPGVAGFNANIYKQIKDLKKKTDLLVVSYHGAAELLPWPSPARQDLFRSLVDAGADIIHGHHAHTPQGWEEYNNGIIFYGLGNFCVDPAKWSWHPNGTWSLAPEISYINKKIKFKLKTTVIRDYGNEISVNNSNKKESVNHFSYLKLCNEPLKNRKLLEGLWQEASLKMYHDYYVNWLGFNSLKKIRYLKTFAIKLIRSVLPKKNNIISFKTSRLLLHYHLFACNSHNDAISTALGLLGGELKDLRNKRTKKLINKWMISEK